MQRHLIILSLLFLIFSTVLVGQEEVDKENFSQTLLIEDFDYMLKALEKTHPNLYAYIPKKEFQNKTDEIKKSINRPLSKPEFFKILLKTIALVKQGHTRVFGDPGFKAFQKAGGLAFPYNVKFDSDHIYINENYSSNKTLIKGTELIAINRIPVCRIIDDFTPYLRVRPNGFIGSTLEFNWTRYLWMVYGFDKQFTLSYILPNEDIIRTDTVIGVGEEQLKKKKSEKDRFRFRIEKDRNLAVMTINTFEFDFDEYNQILLNSFSSIKEEKIENLIIDIRENGGGNADLVSILVDYLTDKPYITTSSSQMKTSDITKKCYTTHPIFINAWEQARKAEGDSEGFQEVLKSIFEKPSGTLTDFPKKEVIPTSNENRFGGNLYVLTSHPTFSAATGFSVIIKDNKIGSIVGEETSDNPTDYGCIMLFELPHTKINIQNSTEYTVRPAGYDDEHGVIPDFRIKSTYSDFLNGTDKIMNYTYWLIDEGIKN